MRSILLTGVIAGALAGCSASDSSPSARQVAVSAGSRAAMTGQALARPRSSIAGFPDRGTLDSYGRGQPVKMGASVWYPVQVSEAHALNSIQRGGMVVSAPDGSPIRLKYERKVEHPNGDWSWVGTVAGAPKGQEAVFTFGKKAVFASIPNGSNEPLELTTRGARTWMVQTDGRMLSNVGEGEGRHGVDYMGAPAPQASSHKPAAASAKSMLLDGPSQTVMASPTATVDLVLGYTTGFANLLGGASQAVTRLNFLVDVANQAYANSVVSGRLRLVGTVMVDYPDATRNRTALLELSGQNCTTVPAAGQHYLPDTGVNCTPTTVPAALQPILNTRQQRGGDLAGLVRVYSVPENQSCGVAWLLGGGQTPITASSAPFGLSVISDSSGSTGGSTCRSETLAHELGHNMGLAHDRATAADVDDSNGDNDPLDPEEYGRYADSFGYSTGAGAGNFYTIMTVPVSGQTAFRVFSNPAITFCGGERCGQAGIADNASTLRKTMPIVAAFRPSMTISAGNWLQGDYDGDGRADILWRNSASGTGVYWKAANSTTRQTIGTVSDLAWGVGGIGDFDGDGKSDLLWHNTITGANIYWKSANVATRQAMPYVGNPWTVGGVGDFNGDGRSDVMWRNTSSGANTVWFSADSTTRKSFTSKATTWTVAGIGDFNGDHRADIMWRNQDTGDNSIWFSGNSATRSDSTVNLVWSVAAVGDFSGDGKADILWRNYSTGVNVLWLSGDVNTRKGVASLDVSWRVVGAGDFDHDGKVDVLWRNINTGLNQVWKAANAATKLPVTGVTNLDWIVI